MKKTWVFPAAGVCLLAGAIAILWPEAASRSEVPPDSLAPIKGERSGGAKVSLELPTVTIPTDDANTPLPPLPPELQGLEPKADLAVDAEGHLIPSSDLRVLLDFYLANVDQEPLDTVLMRIRMSLGSRLQEPALGQALSLLARYVGYRMALEEWQDQLPAGVTQNGLDLAALQQRQALLEQLQHEHFSREEKSAFFEEDTRVDTFTLARLAIEQDESLNPTQKAQRLDQLTQQLPEPIRLARKRAVIHGEVYQQAEALKTANASDAEIYQLRAQELGEDAAMQLAELDRQQRQWQERLSDYRQEKARLEQAGLSESDRDSAIAALRAKQFSDTEQLRVRALEADWQ